jgi:hypothetical protein
MTGREGGGLVFIVVVVSRAVGASLRTGRGCRAGVAA